jgi:multimeric flavodoxin WrbA
MKVLMINGSPHEHGCTRAALDEAARALNEAGAETELLWLGTDAVPGCLDCGGCRESGRCVRDDAVNEALEKMERCGGLIVGAPVHFASPGGSVIAFLDRMFYAGDCFAFKPAAAVVCARRAGTTASLDVLCKYFTIARMPVVSSTYWNMVHGRRGPDAQLDAEGLQTMRNLGRNMAWLMACIEAGGRAGIPLPQDESGARTDFIRR